MGKKKSKKTGIKYPKKPFVLLLITLLVIALLFIAVRVKTNPSKSSTQAATSSQITKPTSKPTPTPLPIPAQSGRSVRVPILTYHYIGNNPNPEDKARDNLSVAPDKFEEELAYLAANGYNAITFDTLYSALSGASPISPKAVILSFDDGYMDFYYNAFPVLKRYNLHAVVFIPTGLMGGSYYLTWDQIKEMDASGLISFQSHSVNHSNLLSLTDEQLKYQLSASKQILQDQLGKGVNTFAYPYGISDQRTWAAVKAAGYVGAVGTWYGNIESEGTQLDMPRIKVGGGTDIINFASKL